MLLLLGAHLLHGELCFELLDQLLLLLALIIVFRVSTLLPFFLARLFVSHVLLLLLEQFDHRA